MLVIKPKITEFAGFSIFLFLYFNLLRKHFYFKPYLYSCFRSLGPRTFQTYSGKPFI